jgi:hypothetical protein
MEGGQVGWKRALIVSRIGAGGLGYGDVDGHAATSVCLCAALGKGYLWSNL